jgi:hypothetical protein
LLCKGRGSRTHVFSWGSGQEWPQVGFMPLGVPTSEERALLQELPLQHNISFSCFCSCSSWLFRGASSTRQKEAAGYIHPLWMEGWTEGLTGWKKLHFITTMTSFTLINITF